MSRYRIHVLLWLAATTMVLSATGQPLAERVEGQVVRESGGVPVQGANVVLVGTLYGAVTDEAGRFSFGLVRPGRYGLRVSISGLAVVERTLTVPDDLHEPLVIPLRESRAELVTEPLAAVAESFRGVVVVPRRGDPYLPDKSVSVRRLAGTGQRRFASAYAGPLLRGLSGGRTGAASAMLSGGLLSIPGVGTLDFASMAVSRPYGLAILDPVAGAMPGDEYVGLFRDRMAGADGSGMRDRAVVDLGYQSNLNAFSTGVFTAGHSPRIRTVASGHYTAGSDFASGSGEEWGGAFSHGGAFVATEVSPVGGSTVTMTGRVATAGNADLPGSGLEMERASHADVAVAWTTTPEGRRIRRTHLSVGWARSSADFVETETGLEWSLVEADETHMRASASLDLYAGLPGQFQTGIAVSARTFDWLGVRLPPSLPDVRLDAGRVRLAPFVLATAEMNRIVISLAGRLDVVRTRLVEVDEGAPDISLWRTLPGLSAAATLRPDRHWSLSLTASTTSKDAALPSFSRIELPTTDRLPAVRVAGDPDLDPERIYFVGARLTRSHARQELTLGTFAMSIGGYISPVSSSGRFIYANTDATLTGFETTMSRDLLPFVTVSGHLSYVWARNRSADEPLPLVYPLNGRVDLTASAARGRLLFELSTEFAVRQNRVAVSLGERPSDGYAVFHLGLALPVTRRFGFRTGVFNLFDTRFAPHGHVFVQERDARLPAPGRAWVISGQFRY